MNKKFFLSVFLLGALTLSSGVLTSCIDNDEPEGITTLRGAKAELLRAKAALELAKAETEKQQALYVAAMAEHEKALAEVAKAEAEKVKAEAAVEAAKVAIVEAQAAQENAKAEQEKADAAKKLAEAEAAKSKAEMEVAQYQAQIEEIKQNMELTRLQLEALIAGAQQTLDQTLADIEAAKAVLTDAQAQQLATLKNAVNTAWAALKDAQSNILNEMKNVFDATNDHADQTENLEDALTDAKAKLIAVNAAYDELTALANSVSITAWEARRDSINLYVGEGSAQGSAAEEKAILALKKLEIEQSAEYKEKAAADAAARDAYVLAQMEYNYLADESKMDCFTPCVDGQTTYTASQKWGFKESGTHPTTSARTSAKKYEFDGVTIPIENENVRNKVAAFTALTSDWWGEGFYIDGHYNWASSSVPYSTFKNAFNPWTDIFDLSRAVSKWKWALSQVTFTDEELAADECQKDYEKAIEKAQEKHDENVAAWQKAHKAYSEQKVEQTVSTATFAADIKKYNDNIDALEAAVTAYNTAYDKAADDIYANNVEEYVFDQAKSAIQSYIGVTIPAGVKTLAKYNSWVAEYSGLDDSTSPTLTQAKTKASSEVSTERGNLTDAIRETLKATHTDIIAVEAVEKAVKAIESGDPDKPGVVDIIKVENTATNRFEKGTYSNGSYASIADAVTAFKALAEANCETLNKPADSNTTAIEGYTGVATADKKPYINGGSKTTPTYGAVTTANWVMAKMELNSSDVYVDKGHKQVVRKQISDANVVKMATVKFDAAQAETNWKATSEEAFGTDASNARHTELTADLVKEPTPGTYKDENGEPLPNYAGSTLKKLVDAKQALADHEALAGGPEALAAVLETVEAYETSLKAKIAEYQKPIDEAYAAIAPAKKAHQAAHNAAHNLVADVEAEIAAINIKINDLNAIKGKLDAIIAAYYSNLEFSYTNEDGTTVTCNPTDVENLKTWIKNQMAAYEGATGKIKDAEDAIKDAQKELDRYIADDEFDAVAHAQLKLEQAQQDLAVAQQNYDFALAQLNAYVAALGQ